MIRTALAVAHVGTGPQICGFCGTEFRADAGFGLVELMANDLSPACVACGQTIDRNAVELLQNIIDAAKPRHRDAVVELVRQQGQVDPLFGGQP
jgi:hypothetical protein